MEEKDALAIYRRSLFRGPPVISVIAPGAIMDTFQEHIMVERERL